MRKKKVRNGRNHKAQILTCFLVTEPERLPSENESQWYHIITAIDPLQASPSPANSPASSSPPDSPASSSPSSSSSTSPVKTHTQLQPPATCTQLQSSSESTSTSLQTLSSQTQNNNTQSSSPDSCTQQTTISQESSSSTNSAFSQPSSLLQASMPDQHHNNIPIHLRSYFHSKEARNVFGYSKPKSEEEANRDVRDIIYERMLQFQKGAFTYSGWRDLMEHADKKNKCDVRFINAIQMKAKYLFHAFSILIDRKENEPLT